MYCGVAPRPGDTRGGLYMGVSCGEYARPGESEARRLVPLGTGGDHDRARLPAAPCDDACPPEPRPGDTLGGEYAGVSGRMY